MSSDPEDRWISSAGRPWAGRKPSERSLALAPSALPSLHLQLTMDPLWLCLILCRGKDVEKLLTHLNGGGHLENGESPFDWKVYLLNLLGYQICNGGTDVLFRPILKLEDGMKLLIEA